MGPTPPNTSPAVFATPNPMLAAIRSTPELFDRGWRAASGAVSALGIDRDAIRALVVCGMGGSAFPADIVRLLPRRAGVRIDVSRGYTVDTDAERPLVVASSFSGNTEETLAAFADARRRGWPCVAMSCGGRLAERAATTRAPLVRLDRPSADFQPRAATAMFVGALARLACDAGLIDDPSKLLERAAEHLRAMHAAESVAAQLAEQLHGRIPVIVAPRALARSTARVIKIKFNENAKMPAFWSALPEFNHNEMVGYTRSTGPFSVVMLDDPRAAPRMRHRLRTTCSTLEAAGLPVHRVDLPKAEPLVQCFAALYVFDLATCALALLDGVDPNPVTMVESFKTALGAPPTD